MFPISTQDKGLRKLNLGIAFMLSASATSGYNASQINSLLVLPECTFSVICPKRVILTKEKSFQVSRWTRLQYHRPDHRRRLLGFFRRLYSRVIRRRHYGPTSMRHYGSCDGNIRRYCSGRRSQPLGVLRCKNRNGHGTWDVTNRSTAVDRRNGTSASTSNLDGSLQLSLVLRLHHSLGDCVCRPVHPQ